MKSPLVLNHCSNKKGVPKPQTKKFIWGELVEVVKLSWENGKVVEYIATMKCRKHIGCQCGIEKVFKLYDTVNSESFPKVNYIKTLISRYGQPRVAPMITRECSKNNSIYCLSDEYNLYGELNLDNEIKLNEELKAEPRKTRKQKRLELVKKYGHLINAAPVCPIYDEEPEGHELFDTRKNSFLF